MYEYKNPFSDFDSNVMSSEQIYELFTEPYDSFTFPKRKIIEDKSPIIFIGGRGTGKTMLLRQFSYNVQRITENSELYIDKVKRTGYVGVYFRIDKPLLQSLSSLGKLYAIDNFEEAVFTHFFELTIFKEYLELIKIFEEDLNLSENDIICRKILEELIGLFPIPEEFVINNIEQFLSYVVEEINYIWKFQSKKAIDINNIVDFTPRCNLILQGRLSDEISKTSVFKLLGINNLTILLLIDEFESFSIKQQMVINAAMRYNKEYGARLRIGMRPYGFRTFDTINSEDFIKEGRDYSKIEFNNPLVKKGNDLRYFKLVEKIAQKRLSTVPMFEKMNIIEILGKEEDLEREARDIVKGRNKHIEVYLKEINKRNNANYSLETIKSIRDDNPLYEMECLRLLLKGKTIQFVNKALNDYKNNLESKEKKKFSDDYDNKYKLSFVFVLCSIYKKEKKEYYGFKDYCYLSSGIVGAFIELCRRAFDLAYFREPVDLQKGAISKAVQTDAAYEYSHSEKDMICRIAEHGKKLDVFINNIGSAFSVIHRDILLRYPETNMFPDNPNLSEENRSLLELACNWSLIFKKPNNQDSSRAGKSQNIYILSRVFSPIYKISYRTRGGLNPIKYITDEYFDSEFDPEKVLNNRKLDNKEEKKNIVYNQMTLFD